MALRQRICGIALGATLLAACTPAPTTVVPTPSAGSDQQVVLRLDFEGTDPLAPTTGAVAVKGIGVNGGALEVVASHDGGRAAGFPVHVDGEDAPGLVLMVTATEVGLPDLGERDFSYGADVRLGSWAASEEDNGDNVLQRGLASDPTQFKLQVDRGVPSCVVAGSRGRVLVKGSPLEPDAWYSLRCDRAGDQVTLTATPIGGAAQSVVASRSGEIGAVSFDAARPVSIGRKVTAEGAPVLKQPDQFNGVLDSVWLSVARG